MKSFWGLFSIAMLAVNWSTTIDAMPDHFFDEATNAGRLFVGTCYQPVDRTPEQIHRDIQLMKNAGFNIVRMGDLSWDYFEPSEGKFNFKGFDQIMDEMHTNGIKVILDVPG